MGPAQAALVTKPLGIKRVIPMHYKTFPILEQDALSFKELVKKEGPGIEVVILDLGQEYEI